MNKKENGLHIREGYKKYSLRETYERIGGK